MSTAATVSTVADQGGVLDGAEASTDLRTRRAVTLRSLQIALGAVWLLDGLLQLQPKMFGTGFVTMVLQPAATGQPSIVRSSIDHVASLVSVHPSAFNAVFAVVQILIGVGLIFEETVKPALAASVVWALGVWTIGEGFGMVLTGTASPLTGAPGAVLLYGLLAFILWPRPASDRWATRSRPAAAAGLLGVDGTRVVWAAVWLTQAVLWLLPANRDSTGVSGAIAGAASGEPGWLARLQLSAAHALGGSGTAVAVILAVVSVAIGLGPLITRRTTVFLVAGAALSLDYWILGQSLGGIFTGMATDPNTGPLVVLLALTLFPSRVLDRRRPSTSVVEAPAGPGAAPSRRQLVGVG